VFFVEEFGNFLLFVFKRKIKFKIVFLSFPPHTVILKDF